MKARLYPSLVVAVLALQASVPPALAADVCAAPIPGPALERVRGLVSLGAAGWLVDASAGARYLNPEATRLAPLDGSVTGRIDDVVPISPDSMIVLTSSQAAGLGGVFRLDIKDLRVREISGSEPLKVTSSGRLPNGGILLGTPRGLFRVDGGQQLRDISKSAMGAVTVLQQTDESTWLVGTQNGLFRFDSRAARLDGVPGADVGGVTEVSKMADGGWLIAGDRGLLRTDSSVRSAAPLPLRKPGRILGIHKLADGAWLVRSDSGLSWVDADGRKPETLSDEPGSGWKVIRADSAGVLLGSERLLYSLQASPRRLEVISGEAGTDIYSTHEVPGGWLISSRRGLFRIDHARFKLTAVKGPAPGRIEVLQPVSSGSILIQASNGLFRTDPAMQKIEPLPGANTGYVQVFNPLKGGGALVGAERGLFWADSDGRKLTAVAGSTLSEVTALHPLKDGTWLAVGAGGVVAVDASGQHAASIPGIASGPLVSVQGLAGLGALVVSPKEVLAVSGDLDSARVEVDVSSGIRGEWWKDASSATVITLKHRCAALAENLGLSLEARPAGVPEAPGRVLGITWRQASADGARLATDLSSLPAGRWTLRLVADAGGQVTPVGEPFTLSHQESVLQWIRNHALVLLAIAMTLHLFVALTTLLFARHNPGLLRALRHPIWSKLAVWPSILFRYSEHARIWVLAPWFRTVRNSTPTDATFVDVQVTGPSGESEPLSRVLGHLREGRRIWLYGRPGMGKTEALAFWERAFFAGHHSIEAAARAHGFLFVPVSARLIAESSDGRAGEAILEAALQETFRRRGVELDRRFLRTMTRRSSMVIALDQVCAAQRDGLIAAFLRNYPAARLLVASDAKAPDGFETWSLPAGPTRDSTEALLRLWLGSYSGSRLATRIVREGLEPHLISAHDVRLVADMVTADPDMPLPTDRAGLYQGVIERAARAGVPLADIARLKTVAWTMALEGRRDLSPEESAALGPDTKAALRDARILSDEDGGSIFNHDLIRVFLAASWLVENRRDAKGLAKELQNSRIWERDRVEQEELWRFLVQLLKTEDVTGLWPFALENPDRVHLVAALYGRARTSNLFPLGLSAATGSSIMHLSRRRPTHAMPVVSASTAS